MKSQGIENRFFEVRCRTSLSFPVVWLNLSMEVAYGEK